MATCWEGAAHSVNHVLSLLCIFVILVVSNFGFEGETLVLIAPVPDHCLHFTSQKKNWTQRIKSMIDESSIGDFILTRSEHIK